MKKACTFVLPDGRCVSVITPIPKKTEGVATPETTCVWTPAARQWAPCKVHNSLRSYASSQWRDLEAATPFVRSKVVRREVIRTRTYFRDSAGCRIHIDIVVETCFRNLPLLSPRSFTQKHIAGSFESRLDQVARHRLSTCLAGQHSSRLSGVNGQCQTKRSSQCSTKIEPCKK